MVNPSSICSFALALPVYHRFDYQVDAAFNPQPGMRFVLPFGSGHRVGVLIAVGVSAELEENKLKPVTSLLDESPLLPAHLLELALWVADYYCQPVGEVVFQFLPGVLRKAHSAPETRQQFWRLTRTPDDEELQRIGRRAPRQLVIIQALLNSEHGLHGADLRELQTDWHQPIKSLQSKGLVSSELKPLLAESATPQIPGYTLTADQHSICQSIAPLLDEFLVHLIQGVTGSGKTEIYLTLMQQVIARGQQVIYLVPEIGLTPQLLQRLQSRLGQAVVTSHSGLTDFNRYQSWDQFRSGVVPVICGTRSALFSASEALGLIIIDEEHDASYRQQDGVRYHARDVAIKRAQMLNIPVVLGSATPSAESLHNIHKSHFRLYRLDQRVSLAQPPAIELLDCSQLPLTSGCSTRLLQAVDRHLSEQGQVLLFLNRRGFAPMVMCHECGWQSGCHQCDARLTLHQSINRLICHHCGFSMPLPQKCPDCGAADIKHYGVGTEQLEQFLQSRFAQAEVIRIDRDTVSSMQHFETRMEPVNAGRPCILIGTQMLAKGHDYPHITLVGILDADQALYSSFYRASERLIQTVIQVSGRAGRAGKKGQALLQTAFPSHPLMQGLCQQSYSELMEPILQERKLLGFPPYARVVTFQVDALELALALQKLKQLKQFVQEVSDGLTVKVIGPIPALMTRRIGRYRAQLSVMASDFQALRQLLQRLMPRLQSLKNTQKSRLTIEVDPLDL